VRRKRDVEMLQVAAESVESARKRRLRLIEALPQPFRNQTRRDRVVKRLLAANRSVGLRQ